MSQAEYMRQYRQSNRGWREQATKLARAKRKAVADLIDRYPEEYDRLLAKRKTEEGL